MKKTRWLFVLPLLLLFNCDENNDLVLFSIEDDKKLGAQVAAEIESNPSEFPILDENEFSVAYNYLNGIKNEILNSGEVTYADEFVWELKIIENDNVLNAFATPGGYIYVYTGLIKFLDKEDDLAGVLGHEIAHADQRHSSKQLQRVYGIQILLSIILGQDPSALQEIVAGLAGNLATLKFGREAESEADEYSVIYLAETDYQCNATFSFFQKMIDTQQTGQTPEFLSTHPNPEDRVADINTKANELNCNITPLNPASYESFKAMLP